MWYYYSTLSPFIKTPFEGMGEIVYFIGLDLTASARRKTACVALGEGLHISEQGFCGEDEEIIVFVGRHRPAIVAIDAPLGLPRGLCCLEETCCCQPISNRKGRRCERELSKLGIGCYYTTKRSIIKGMVYRGIRLKEELSSRGFVVIEVYPYASKVRLFSRLPPKGTAEGRKALQRHLRQLIPVLPPPEERLYSHDLLDALVAAYTGYLYLQGKTEPLGEEAEGLIHIPKSPYFSPPS